MQRLQTLQTRNYQNLGDCKLQFQVKPIKPFGAEIVGFDFEQEASADHVHAIRNALLEHKMLLLRDKCLLPEQQVAFTRLFGYELHRAGPKLRYLPDHPEVIRIANRPGEGNPNTGQYWHADGHYMADPSSVTVMHIVNATRDGATYVADSAEAYDRLSEINKEYLSRHGFLATETGVVHPIVRRHPLTGRPGLYVNLRAIAIDRNRRQLPQISEMIDKHLSQPSTFYEHHWKQGDTIIVDNFSSAHRGTTSNPANLRVMHRTTVTGPAVWWRAQP